MTFREDPALQAALDQVTARLANARAEDGYILSPRGTVLFEGTGELDRIRMPLHLIRGNIVIHSHPGGDSFSRADVRLLMTHRALQARIVTREWVYVLAVPDAEWDDVRDLVEALKEQVDAEHRGLILAGRLSSQEAQARRWHDVWTGVAEIRGWTYRHLPVTGARPQGG